ncbi:MAG TPA: MaoC family dehydratase N-terminal domain-containing protein [Acidimicrobiia bacterium]|nr:MaoC family dehydratase N-terminal domain-containing protein [Acidimicrobiia bacterium]
MAVDVEHYKQYIGKPTGTSVITIERQPVSNFAKAVKDTSPIYQDADAAKAAGFDSIPTPPTWGFAMGSWGAYPEDQPPSQGEGASPPSPLMNIIGELMRAGGLVLHGEQEFEYHKPLTVGMKLTHAGRVADVYAKESGERVMTFVVTENEYRDEAGELVLTARMNLIHRS